MYANEQVWTLAAGITVFGYAAIRWAYQRAQSSSGWGHAEQRRTFLYGQMVMATLPFVLFMISPWAAALRLNLPDSLRWLGVITGALGLACLAWTHETLGRNWSPFVETRRSHMLITAGPYQLLRHPMYAAFFLVGAGLSLTLASWFIAAGYLTPVVILYMFRVPREEAMMIEHFGEQYLRYMQTAGRVLPQRRMLVRCLNGMLPQVNRLETAGESAR